MLIRTLQWNIGGGKIRNTTDDPRDASKYIQEGLPHIIELIRNISADIITLQETHANEKSSQAARICREAGFPHVVNDQYDASHLEDGQSLCQSVLSKFPLENHTFQNFYNPKFTTVRPDGAEWISHNKGVTACEVVLTNTSHLFLQTLHVIPFAKFGIALDDARARRVLDDVEEKLAAQKSPALLQGDFNIEDVQRYLPKIGADFDEVFLSDATTPWKTKTDHVLYRELSLKTSRPIKDVLTDHYPLYCEFDIAEK